MAVPLMLLAMLFVACSSEAPTQVFGKSPRNMEWYVDTLQHPSSFQTLLTDLWASSSSDAYAVGHDAALPAAWHFDGKRWQSLDLTFLGACDFYSIIGFSPFDIFSAGARFFTNQSPPPNFIDSGLVTSFDGQNWRRMDLGSIRGEVFYSIWGTSAEDVWAGGKSGQIIHFDGQSWKEFPSEAKGAFLKLSGLRRDEAYALEAPFKPESSSVHYLHRWNGIRWSRMDSTDPGYPASIRFGIVDLESISGSMYSAGQGVYRLDLDGWTNLRAPQSASINGIDGVARDNLICVGSAGQVLHYNGEDWRLVTQVSPTIVWQDVQIGADYVFAVGIDNNKSYLLRGR